MRGRHFKAIVRVAMALLTLTLAIPQTHAAECDGQAGYFSEDFRSTRSFAENWKTYFTLREVSGGTRLMPQLVDFRPAGEGMVRFKTWASFSSQIGTQCDNFHFGRYRFVAKVTDTTTLPLKQGVVFGLFLFRDRRPQDPNNEIDIEFTTRLKQELTTDSVNFFTHTATGMTAPRRGAAPLAQSDCEFGERCTFEFDWTQRKIDFYVNGNSVRTIYGENVVPQQPGEVRIMLWSGNKDFGGNHPWRPVSYDLYEFTYEPYNLRRGRR
ncbi:MAG: glycoside hydrolase family 16 protein [Pseudomonadota bacterium]|nr:glycoside hydrolase family 16 protein [Pseudomonadota bacterium]